MKVCTVEQMRAMDRRAIEEHRIPEDILMENAGDAAYAVIRREVGVTGKRFAVVCGGGNNGGDGFVVARKLFSAGGTVHVFLFSDPERYQGAAKRNLEILHALPLIPVRVQSPATVESELKRCDLIVDALFGTGLARDVGGVYRDSVKMINHSAAPVLSLDIPSGIHGDTGNVMGDAVRADYTVTFGLPKIGNLLYPGYGRCGRLYVSHLSFPPSLYADDALQIELGIPPELPPRNPAGHKGTFGDVLFIAGAASYFGAPRLSAGSFMKAGGGYSRLAAPSSLIPSLASAAAEIVFVPQEEAEDGSMSLQNESRLMDLSEAVDLVVIGPGLSLDAEPQELVRRLVQEIEKPVLVDGDGLTALGDDGEITAHRSAPTVLTPHLGEMTRLTGKSVEDLQSSPIDTLRSEASRRRAIIVLKGAHSLIGYPDGRVAVNCSGNSGMATAGSGDVLTGTIAAMFGLGLPIDGAVPAGVFVHGLAGDLAAREKGEDGITATDILEYLPRAVRTYREHYRDLLIDIYGTLRTV